MSQSFDYADGATGGEPQGPPPNVYLPQAAPPPAYDGYADPAAAHGWQDEGAAGGVGATRELPVVPAGGRSGAGHRARRRKSPWRTLQEAMDEEWTWANYPMPWCTRSEIREVSNQA
ncbi:hypothetical protein ABZ313_42455, partial [Streptomyces sp. NPDC006251]